jgi:hypothetical protein
MLIGALVLSSPGPMPSVLTSLPKNRPAYPILYRDAREQLAMVRALRKPSLVAVVSVSQYFLDMARGILSPIIGRTHQLQEYRIGPEGRPEIGTADLTFCDCVAERVLRKRSARNQAVPYRLVSQQCIAKVRAAMLGQ